MQLTIKQYIEMILGKRGVTRGTRRGQTRRRDILRILNVNLNFFYDLGSKEENKSENNNNSNNNSYLLSYTYGAIKKDREAYSITEEGYNLLEALVQADFVEAYDNPKGIAERLSKFEISDCKEAYNQTIGWFYKIIKYSEQLDSKNSLQNSIELVAGLKHKENSAPNIREFSKFLYTYRKKNIKDKLTRLFTDSKKHDFRDYVVGETLGYIASLEKVVKSAR